MVVGSSIPGCHHVTIKYLERKRGQNKIRIRITCLIFVDFGIKCIKLGN